MAKGWANLHGHSHGRLKPLPRQFDVGVEVWNFRPGRLAEVIRGLKDGVPLSQTAAHMLPDVLCPGLRVVFCGTAAGAVSAARGAYFAGPGNRFWSILAEIKLAPHQLKPDELRLLPTFGIGLTDIAKSVSGADSELPIGSFDVPGFANRVRVVRPRLVAFNGMRAAGAFRPYRTAGHL